MKDNNLYSDFNNKENNKDNNKEIKKRKLSKFEKDIIKLNYLSNLKIKKKYNCTKKLYEKNIISYLLNNANCHLVSIFKEKMLTDYIDEFLRRQYSIEESNERIPKFAIYYKNYLLFFCQPTFSNFVINEIINDYGERRAELYYKNNYQGGKSNDNEDLGFQESDSEEESEKNYKFKNNENGEIFDDTIKENIDNVTIMTTTNNSKNNTINLNLNNEKIEVFSENKCDKSNDTTLHDLMDIVKKGKHNFLNKKNNEFEKNRIEKNENNKIDNNTNTNFNRIRKCFKNKKINDIINIIDFKKAILNRGAGLSQNKKKEGNKSVKKYIEKTNIEFFNLKGKKLKKKISNDKLQIILKKVGRNIKNINYNKKNHNFPMTNVLSTASDKNNKEKININSNLNLIKLKEIKEIYNIKINKKFSNYSANVNLKNKTTSKDKDKKSKNNQNNNNFSSIKNSYGNINNNIIQNNCPKNNNYYYIGGHCTKKKILKVETIQDFYINKIILII